MISPTIPTHDLLAWLNEEILKAHLDIPKPHFVENPAKVKRDTLKMVEKRVRYMQVHSDSYREQFDGTP